MISRRWFTPVNLLLFLACAPSTLAISLGEDGAAQGQVFCEDTGKVARYAEVHFVEEHGGATFVATTDDNGTFFIQGLAPGRYWISGTYPGYITTQERFASQSKSPNPLSSTGELFVVSSGQTTYVPLTLIRGAVIRGFVFYSDGTRAENVKVQAVLKDSAIDLMGILSAQTDDLGHFRIVGLEAGSYVIAVTLPGGESRKWFYGDSSTIDKAKIIPVLVGEYGDILLYLP